MRNWARMDTIGVLGELQGNRPLDEANRSDGFAASDRPERPITPRNLAFGLRA
jgi:hypothetical protein